MDQDDDPCAHGLDSACCAGEMTQLHRKAQEDDDEIVPRQTLRAGVLRGHPESMQEAETSRGLRGLR